MKVNGSGPVQNNAVRRTRKGADRNGTGSFAEEVSAIGSEPAALTQAQAPNSLAPVDSLIALQEVEDSTTGRKRSAARGTEMLNLLDNIRHGLLIGAISREKLQSLVRATRSGRLPTEDPKLQEVLDEIELRAAVELAKYEQS